MGLGTKPFAEPYVLANHRALFGYKPLKRESDLTKEAFDGFVLILTVHNDFEAPSSPFLFWDVQVAGTCE